MTEEIKEIELDHFNNINELKQNVETWIKEDDMYWNRWFSLYDLKTLLDYITNLQQENERLNNIINTFEEYLENVKMNLRYSGTKWDNDCLIRAEVIKQVLDKLKELKESDNNE